MVAQISTYILIIDKDGYGIGYNRKGEIIKQKTWFGPDFTSGYYKETTSGTQTTLERTGNVPSNFKSTITSTANKTQPKTTPAPPPPPAAPVKPKPKPSVQDAPKPNPTSTAPRPVTGAVYRIPEAIDTSLPKSKQIQKYATLLILSPTEAKLTDSNGNVEISRITEKDLPSIQKYADLGYGPPLRKVIVQKSTGNQVPNTGQTTSVVPEDEDVGTLTGTSDGLVEAIDYKDRTKTQLDRDIILTNALLSDSIVTLQNTVVDSNVQPQETLYDRILNSGITPELKAQYGPQIDAYEKKKAQKQAILDAIKEKIKECHPATNNNVGWSAERECPDGFNYSQLRALEAEYEKEIRDLPDPCGKSTLAGINNALLKFFNFLKGVKKYYNLYVKGTINKIQNLTAIIANTANIIGAILKLLVQRMRNWILNLLRKLIEKVINKILTSLTKALKNTVIKAIVDALICAFDKIISGLAQLVTDFLFSLIGNVINAAFCAVEQFTNALINNLAAQIDKTLQPILSQINNVLGGVAKIAGSVFQAIDFILGFEAFLCAKPDCPQIKSFKADAWAGPTPAMEEAFNNFIPIPDAAQAEEWALNQVNGFLDKNNVLTGATIFGDKYNDLNQNLPPRYENLLTCNTGAWRCGPPKAEFFGGGGAGAVGDTIVNSIGDVVGVNLRFGGSGYTSPPFVTFTDNCDNGNFASAYTIINNQGQVIKVVMVNSGTGYLNAPTGLDEFETLEQEEVENTTTEYVGCLDEIQVLSTGIGYSPSDSVSITPDIPGLQVKIQMTEIGQIVAMEILTAGCGVVETPEITINSKTGAGLEVRPLVTFYDKQKYLSDINTRADFQDKVVQVTQCVFK